MEDLREAIAIRKNGQFLIPLNTVDIIKEGVENIFILDVSKEFLEKCGRWYAIKSGGEAAQIKSIIPLYTIETFKMLMQKYELTHEYRDQDHKDWLLNHLIQYEKPLSHDLLEFVLADGLKKGQNYNVDEILSLVENVENAEWLLSKGAKCCTIPGYGQTFHHILTSAIVTKSTEVLDLIIKKKKVDYDWLTEIDKDGFLNIDAEIVYYGNHIQAVYLLRKLLKDERIVTARKEWMKTAKRRCVEELEKIQKELCNLIIPENES